MTKAQIARFPRSQPVSVSGAGPRPHQPDRLRDGRCARLESVRRRGVGRALHADGFDHLPAAHERGQLREKVFAAPQQTDAGRAAQLVAGERDEVRAQRRMSTGSCGTAWEPSTTTSAPASRARRASSATGLIVPSMFRDPHQRDDLGALGDQASTSVSPTCYYLGRVRANWYSRSPVLRLGLHGRTAALVERHGSSNTERRAKLSVPATQVAEWADHTAAVLLQIYAKCLAGQEELARMRIDTTLRGA